MVQPQQSGRHSWAAFGQFGWEDHETGEVGRHERYTGYTPAHITTTQYLHGTISSCTTHCGNEAQCQAHDDTSVKTFYVSAFQLKIGKKMKNVIKDNLHRATFTKITVSCTYDCVDSMSDISYIQACFPDNNCGLYSLSLMAINLCECSLTFPFYQIDHFDSCLSHHLL